MAGWGGLAGHGADAYKAANLGHGLLGARGCAPQETLSNKYFGTLSTKYFGTLSIKVQRHCLTGITAIWEHFRAGIRDMSERVFLNIFEHVFGDIF